MEIIEILLAFGANPSVRDVRGNTCLHMATAVRSSEALKLLAESVNSKDELNAFNNFGKNLKLIDIDMATINNISGITPLHIAMMNDGLKSMVHWSLQYVLFDRPYVPLPYLCVS